MTINASQPRSLTTRVTGCLGALSGVGLAMVPAAGQAYLNEFDGGLVLPLVWICGATVVLPFIYALSIITPLLIAKLLRRLISTFIVATLLVLILGFSWTGDWIRFMGFELGLEQLPIVASVNPTNYTFYYWSSWGFAGLEGDSYLVYDPSGDIGRLSSNDFIKGTACHAGDNRPMIPPWRLITTFECSLTSL